MHNPCFLDSFSLSPRQFCYPILIRFFVPTMETSDQRYLLFPLSAMGNFQIEDKRPEISSRKSFIDKYRGLQHWIVQSSIVNFLSEISDRELEKLETKCLEDQIKTRLYSQVFSQREERNQRPEELCN